MKVKELIKELKLQNPDAPVTLWAVEGDRGHKDIVCFGQDKDEIVYQVEDEGLTEKQALDKVSVELHAIEDD